MKRSLVAAAIAALSLQAFAGAPASYTIVDLGADYQPHAVNPDGTLAGATISTRQPALYANGAWSALPVKGTGGEALAINAKGVAAGWSGSKSAEWKGGKVKSLTGTNTGEAEGIADDGTIVGSEFGGSFNYCYKWKSGTKTGIDGGGDGDCYTHAIDPTAAYIGGQSGWHAFLVDATGTHDLGTLDGTSDSSSTLQALNKHGHAAVWSTYDSTHAWGTAFWNGQTLVDTGVHPAGIDSYAMALNDNDDMLIASGGNAAQTLFLYAGPSGTVTPIQPLISNVTGWTFDVDPTKVMTAIGNDGSIYGAAKLNGQMHAFKLVPVKK